MSTRYERFQNEMAAGGSVAENTPDEQPDLWVQVVGIGAWIALFGILAIASPWVLVFVVGLLISAVVLMYFQNSWYSILTGLTLGLLLSVTHKVWARYKDRNTVPGRI